MPSSVFYHWDRWLRDGSEFLRSRDPHLASIIERVPAPQAPSQPSPDLFVALVDAVVGQQLSVRAAAAIWERLLAIMPGGTLTPQALVELGDDEARSAGLSRAKVRYVRGIADAVVSGEIDLDAIAALEDEAVIDQLTVLTGVGRWTAEMLLIFALGRPDVFSVGDLGLRNAVAAEWGIDREDRKAIAQIADRWSPYRSLASRYLWAGLDNAPQMRR